MSALTPPPPNRDCPHCLYWLRANIANALIRKGDSVAMLRVAECAALHRRAQAGEFDDMLDELLAQGDIRRDDAERQPGNDVSLPG